MREQVQKPATPAHTLQSKPRANRQAPIADVLQAYRQSIIQRETFDDEELLQSKFETAQRSETSPLRGDRGGLPPDLKAGIENLSGYSMDDVHVNYNSPKPARLQALAYTQGTDIHIAPGQEQHLPHEAWHVVQQKQGRVQPTMQLQGVSINDNEGLEGEADMMGRSAIQRMPYIEHKNTNFKPPNKCPTIIQRNDDEKKKREAYYIWEGRTDKKRGKNPNALGDDKSDYYAAEKKIRISNEMSTTSGLKTEDQIKAINYAHSFDNEERIKTDAYYHRTGDQTKDYFDAEAKDEENRLAAVAYAEVLASKLNKQEIQKVMPEQALKYHLKIKFEDKSGDKKVGGFVTAAESLTSRNFDDVFEGLRLDYANTQFDKSRPFGVIKADIGTDESKLTLATKEKIENEDKAKGKDSPNKPFTGTGMTGSKKMIIPEFRLTEMLTLNNGTLEICNRQDLFEDSSPNIFRLSNSKWE